MTDRDMPPTVPSARSKTPFDGLWMVRAMLLVLFVTPWVMAAQPAHALVLGSVQSNSPMGEPLRIDIGISQITDEEARSLKASLATPDEYQAASIDFNSALYGARATVRKRANGQYYVRVVSSKPVDEPFLHVLVSLSSESGVLTRQYVVLLDPIKNSHDVAPAEEINLARSTNPARRISVSTGKPQPGFAVRATQNWLTIASATQAKEVRLPKRDTSAQVDKKPKKATRQETESASGPSAVSLDQILVAFLKANPNAYIQDGQLHAAQGTGLNIPNNQAIANVNKAQAKQALAEITLEAAMRRTKPGSQLSAEEVRTGSRLVLTEAPSGTLLEELSPQGTAAIGTASAPLVATVGSMLTPPGAPTSLGSSDGTTGALAAASEVQLGSGGPATTSAGKANTEISSKGLAVESRQGTWLSSISVSTVLQYLLPALIALLAVWAERLWSAKRREKLAQEFHHSEDAGDLNGFLETQVVDLDNNHTTPFFDINSTLAPVAPTPAEGAINSVDPITEAEVYLAYSRYDQAVEILKDGMAAEPDRLAIPLKLLEVYAQHQDVNSFDNLASTLETTTHKQGAEWDHVMAIRRALLDTPSTQNLSPDSNELRLEPVEPAVPTLDRVNEALSADIEETKTTPKRKRSKKDITPKLITDSSVVDHYIDLDFNFDEPKQGSK